MTTTTPSRLEARVDRWFRTPPGLWWHFALCVPLLLGLVATSVPGTILLLFLAALVVGLGFGVWWAVWAIGWRLSDPDGFDPRWLVAPALVIVAAIVFSMRLPLQLRFDRVQGQFDEIVEELEPAGSFEDWEPLDVPDRIGGYRITRAYQVGDNVILYEGNGSLLDDAGFAYLPDGIDSRLGTGWFEQPSFRDLGDGWYSFTASW
ncbi:MAG: hypothetical protein AAGE98_19100 [Actinomycetota bacterium]